MSVFSKILGSFFLLIFAVSIQAAPKKTNAVSDLKAASTDADNNTKLAQKKKKRKGKSRAVREKHINREAKQKSRDSKNIDFDAANIGGTTKTPMSSLIGQNKADKNYDFIKIRLRWHPEMIQSASSLSSGSTK